MIEVYYRPYYFIDPKCKKVKLVGKGKRKSIIKESFLGLPLYFTLIVDNDKLFYLDTETGEVWQE